MIREVLLLSIVAGLSLSTDDFFEKYTFAKTMSQCFGESAYETYLLRIAEAKRECNSVSSYTYYTTSTTTTTTTTTRRPFFLNVPPPPQDNPFPGRNPFYTLSSSQFPRVITRPATNRFSGNRERRLTPDEIRRTQLGFLPDYKETQMSNRRKLYDAEAIAMAVDEISYALRNFTCVLGRLELIDQSLNINYDMMVNNYFRAQLDRELQRDLVSGINYCKKLTMCLPEDKSPISHELQRLMAFMKCEKKTRLSACFKHDLRHNIHHFDISALPNDDMRTSDLEKLMTILIGSQSLDQLDLY